VTSTPMTSPMEDALVELRQHAKDGWRDETNIRA